MNYLHEITGGLDNAKRKAVRQLFRDPTKQTVEVKELPPLTDLVIGAVEEFNAIGIKEFKINHVIDTLNIFGVLGCTPPDYSVMVAEILGHPQVRITKDTENVYVVPPLERINQLLSMFCGEDKKQERIKIA